MQHGVKLKRGRRLGSVGLLRRLNDSWLDYRALLEQQEERLRRSACSSKVKWFLPIGVDGIRVGPAAKQPRSGALLVANRSHVQPGQTLLIARINVGNSACDDEIQRRRVPALGRQVKRQIACRIGDAEIGTASVQSNQARQRTALGRPVCDT